MQSRRRTAHAHEGGQATGACADLSVIGAEPAPTRWPSFGNGIARRPAGGRADRATRGGSHVRQAIDRSGRRPALLRQLPRCCAADRHHVHPTAPEGAGREAGSSATGSALRPAHIQQRLSRYYAYGASTTGSLSLHLLTSFAEPRPSGSADPSRHCRGCFPPSPAFPVQAAPALLRCYGTEEVAVSYLHSIVQRFLHQVEQLGQVGGLVDVKDHAVDRRRGGGPRPNLSQETVPGCGENVSSARTQVTGFASGGEVVQDRAKVMFLEPADGGGQAEGLIDPARVEDGGELDRAGHFRPRPAGVGRGGLDQPRISAVTDGQKVGLGFAAGRGRRGWFPSGWCG